MRYNDIRGNANMKCDEIKSEISEVSVRGIKIKQ